MCLSSGAMSMKAILRKKLKGSHVKLPDAKTTIYSEYALVIKLGGILCAHIYNKMIHIFKSHCQNFWFY